MKTDVYAFGSALLDIQVQVSDSIFRELEIEKGNMYLTTVERQQKVLSRIIGADCSDIKSISEKSNIAAGGSAANTVYGISQLSARGALCGKVAADIFGTIYANEMQNSSVLFNENIVEGTTGTCIVMISDDAQRTMLTHLGVSSEISVDDINLDILKNANYLYLEGYLFDSPAATETIFKAIDIARKNNVRIALTVSDAFCIQRHREIFNNLINSHVDLLFANVQEICALLETDVSEDAIEKVASVCSLVAVTDGEHGSTICDNGNRIQIQPFAVKAVDTTGAGDSYAAGLLYGLTKGLSLEYSGRLASFFSSRVVSAMGPRYSGSLLKEAAEEGLLRK